MTQAISNSEIHLLPEHIVDQIKAGEVIERPATLLKELIENSIDAHATKIFVHIINNGMDLIAIEDNGTGINFEELPLAFCRHATSKISQFDDLYKLHSYGFRGEALASMASVSKILCKSNKKGKAEGSIIFHGGEMISLQQEDSPKAESGTQIYVKELFYNTPVRIKFLQSEVSERNQLKRILNAFVLTHPSIEFIFRWDEGPKEHYPIVHGNQMHLRVKKLFEKKQDPLQLLEADQNYEDIQIKLVLSLNSSRGHAGKFNYLFINNRLVVDPQIHKIILNAAQVIWPVGESGNYVLYIHVPPEQLDVNVHPNKTVIKMFQANKVFSVITGTIRQLLPKSQATSHEDNALTALPIISDQHDISFKDFHYKQNDFTAFQTTEHYFDRLDNKEASVSTDDDHQWHILLKNDLLILTKKNEELYIFDNQKLLQRYVHFIFSKQKEWTAIPLLVSSPLKLSKKISLEKLNKLNQIGFELDYVNEKTLVMRSFPRCLTELPYLDILEALLHNPENDIVIKDYALKFQPHERLLHKMITEIGLSSLIQQKIARLLRAEDLLKLL
jgi:DNA mismatch repair protein MutL